MPESADEFYVESRPVLLHRSVSPPSRWIIFGETMSKVWLYITITVMTGAACWVVARYITDARLHTTLAHIGTAAVTWAVVVCAYSWRASQEVPRRTFKERLWSTLADCGLYCALGVGVAAAMWTLLLLRHYETQTEEILTHIAGAFFVSAIVIFGYEWGSEAKRASDLATRLAFVLHGQIGRVIEATSRDGVAHGLANLIGPSKSGELTQQFELFADALKQLGSVRDWPAAGYLAFVQQYHAALTDNARKLAAFTERKGSEYFEIRIPSAANIADVMVNATMRELRKLGGKYYALSDAKTWKELPSFRDAQTVEGHGDKNVNIQRVFVLGKPADKDLELREVAEILMAHYDDARKSKGTYQIRITDTHEHPAESAGIVADAHHFGIFEPDGEKPIVFSVQDENMSQFKIMAASDEMVNRFQAWWGILKPLELPLEESPEDDRIIRDFLLAYSIRRMSPRSEYRGVSKVTTWRNRSFTRFLSASEEALRSRSVVMKRLLVVGPDECFDSSESFDELIQILLEHDSLCEQTDGKYLWRLCKFDDWATEISKEIAFGLFSDTSTPDPIVADVSVEGRPFVKEIGRKEYLRFFNAFEDVWANAKSWHSSIDKIFANKADEARKHLKHPPKE